MHTPWCHNSQAMSKQVEKLSKHFKGFDNLVFARLDASGNEHPKLKVITSKRCRGVIIMVYYVVVDAGG